MSFNISDEVKHAKLGIGIVVAVDIKDNWMPNEVQFKNEHGYFSSDSLRKAECEDA